MQKRTDTFNNFQNSLQDDIVHSGEFYVNRRENVPVHACLSSYRRDFHKISFITKGEGILYYGDKVIEVKNNTLIISNPLIPFKWQPTTDVQEGYFCLFTERFIQSELKRKSTFLSLLHTTKNLVFPLNEISASFIETIFFNIYKEAQSDYINKYDLLYNYIQIIVHEIIKDHTTETEQTFSASERINKMFFNLLEKQLLISSVNDTISLRTPIEFANHLSIHVNHLNRSLKEHTGRTTSQLISERIIQESKSLLLHTDWDISQIAFCLGFQYPSNFQTFFKKQINLSPKEFRQQNASKA